MNSCEVVDGDGDMILMRGKIGADGKGEWEIAVGSGKYANYQANGTFQTTVQISPTESKYVFSATAHKK